MRNLLAFASLAFFSPVLGSEVTDGLQKVNQFAKTVVKYPLRHLETARYLQDDLPFDLLPEEIIVCIDPLFSQQQAEVDLAEVIICIRDAVIEIAEPCLGRFVGFWGPIKCLLTHLFNEELIGELLSGANVDPLGEIDEAAFAPIEGITEEICVAIFGNATDPTPVACLALFDADDFEDFFDALEDRFEDFRECRFFTNLLEDVDEYVLEIFDDDELPLDEISEALEDGLIKNFEECSEFDDGALADTLETDFLDFAAANTQQVTLFATFVALGLHFFH
eukprot:augustus_masked-scaffold_16-processed-gene-6.11-mRNA-1 protein AED:1.00 eAED:1.00 QI:0/-1/0/0/-1/1/1/0/278